jgi:rRNA maturation endonuclease Nob1
MAKIEKKSETIGAGCLLQFLGLVALAGGLFTVVTIVGPLVLRPVGLWLIYMGSKKASWYQCSECGGKVSSKKIRTCPHCGTAFK